MIFLVWNESKKLSTHVCRQPSNDRTYCIYAVSTSSFLPNRFKLRNFYYCKWGIQRQHFFIDSSAHWFSTNSLSVLKTAHPPALRACSSDLPNLFRRLFCFCITWEWIYDVADWSLAFVEIRVLYANVEEFFLDFESNFTLLKIYPLASNRAVNYFSAWYVFV